MIFVLIALALGYNIAAFILGDLAWITATPDWTSQDRAAFVSFALLIASCGYLASLSKHD